MKSTLTIKLEMYCTQIKFTVVDDLIKEVQKTFRRDKVNHNLDVNDTTEGVFLYYNPQNYSIVIAQKFLTHNTLAHEIYHAVRHITEDRDINDQEAQAWLMGHLTEKIYRFLDRRKLTIKHG